MKAGREIDALVAEKVMGWRRMTYAEQYAKCPRPHGYGNDNRLTSYWHSSELHNGVYREAARAEDCPDYYEPEDAWSPSTDIAAAWEVVIHLRSKDYIDFELRMEPGRESATASFIMPAGNRISASANDAPAAICLAALKAVGVEID